MLHAVINDTAGRGYCGPIAIAAITGKPLSEVISAFKKLRRWGPRHVVKGTSDLECRRVLGGFGFLVNLHAEFPIGARPTLARWHRELARWEREPHRQWLVNVHQHWVAISGNWFADTRTKGSVVHIADAPHRRVTVLAVWRIIPRQAW